MIVWLAMRAALGVDVRCAPRPAAPVTTGLVPLVPA
jgi:hypothetical protein